MPDHLLKCDFHLHTNEDEHDSYKIDHDSRGLIDFAKMKGFSVLSLTFHDQLFWDRRIERYAKKKGILLIPGIEKKIEHKEYLILMKKADPDVEKIKTYHALAEFKRKNGKDILIIMPHLFYPKYFPLGFITYILEFSKKRTKEKYAIADAFEYTHFYLRWFNPNKRAVSLAKALSRGIVGNSDAHCLWQMDHTYTLLHCRKDIDSIFKEIKKGGSSVITEPFFFRTLGYIVTSAVKSLTRPLINILNRKN